jgi:hypothetical protein
MLFSFNPHSIPVMKTPTVIPTRAHCLTYLTTNTMASGFVTGKNFIIGCLTSRQEACTNLSPGSTDSGGI